MHLARAPGLVDLLTLTLYVDLWRWRKRGVLAVNLTCDIFDFEVALPYTRSLAVLPMRMLSPALLLYSVLHNVLC